MALPAGDGGLGAWADRPLDRYVYERGKVRREGPLECGRKFCRVPHEFAVSAERFDDLIVSRWKEVGGDRLAVDAELDLPVNAPRRVVAEYGRDVKAVAHGGVELHAVEAEGTVAGEQEDPASLDGTDHQDEPNEIPSEDEAN